MQLFFNIIKYKLVNHDHLFSDTREKISLLYNFPAFLVLERLKAKYKLMKLLRCKMNNMIIKIQANREIYCV